MTDLRVSFPKPCDEAWQDMAQDGCHKRCDVCDQTIFDLEKLTLDEVEALLDGEQEACVRARVMPDGEVAITNTASRGNRGIKAVLGGAASLALAACSTVGGDNVSARFSVSGEVNPFDRGSQIGLVGQERTYKTRPDLDNSFSFTNLVPGTYRLTIEDRCGGQHDLGEVIVGEDDVKVGTVINERACIIIGKMERADPTAHA